MKIKVNKKSATIELESAEEIEGFSTAVEYYMDMVHEPAHDEDVYEADKMMEKINEKFNGK
jgi:hypothetical protein